MEKTLVIVKPDGVQRGLSGEIISRFEKRGFKIAGLKLMLIPRELAEQHYSEHTGKDFFGPLVDFITSSPVVVMALEGHDAVRLVRSMMGALNPHESTPGSIRGDLAISKRFNVVHGSSSVEDAAREVALFFTDAELPQYSRDIDNWLRQE